MASNGTNSNTEFESGAPTTSCSSHGTWPRPWPGTRTSWARAREDPRLPGGFGQHSPGHGQREGRDRVLPDFPKAPEGVKGESLQNRFGVTAVGTMNHLAFDVDPAKFDEYIPERSTRGSRSRWSSTTATSLDGGDKEHYDPETDDGDGSRSLRLLHRSQRHQARVRMLDEDLRRERRQARTGYRARTVEPTCAGRSARPAPCLLTGICEGVPVSGAPPPRRDSTPVARPACT